METKEIRDFAEENLAVWGLTGDGWLFEFNNRKRSIGLCSYKKKTIFFSRNFMELDASEIKDTILHEIAHALTPGEGHNRKWKAMAVRVGARPYACKDTAGVGEKNAKYLTVDHNNRVYGKYHRLPGKNMRMRIRLGQVSYMNRCLWGQIRLVHNDDNWTVIEEYQRSHSIHKEVAQEAANAYKAEFKYAIVDDNLTILKRYRRKPNKKTFDNIADMYVPGRKKETYGKLKIIKL